MPSRTRNSGAAAASAPAAVDSAPMTSRQHDDGKAVADAAHPEGYRTEPPATVLTTSVQKLGCTQRPCKREGHVGSTATQRRSDPNSRLGGSKGHAQSGGGAARSEAFGIHAGKRAPQRRGN